MRAMHLFGQQILTLKNCIGTFYLTAALEYFEYMKIPLFLFPEWMQEQYNLKNLALDGMVYIEMRRAVWGLPQAGILANKRLR